MEIEKRAKRRCSTCGNKASYYCIGCSIFADDAQNEVSVKVFCGIMSGRTCYHDHCQNVFTVPDEEGQPAPNVNRTPANARDVRRRLS